MPQIEKTTTVPSCSHHMFTLSGSYRRLHSQFYFNMVAEQRSLVHDSRPLPRVSSNTHSQVQVHSSEQHGGTTTTTTATGAAAGRNPQVQDITTTVHRRIQHLRGMEIQDDSILGTTRASIQQTASDSQCNH